MKKTLLSLMTGLSLLTLSPKAKAEDIYLNPSQDWVSIVQNTNTSNEPLNIHFDKGEYYDTTSNQNLIQVPSNVNLEGFLDLDNLKVTTQDWKPVTNASTVIYSRFELQGDNEVKNIFFDGRYGNSGVNATGTKFNLENLYFYNSNILVVHASEDDKTYVTNCVFDGSKGGGIWSELADHQRVKVRRSKFINCEEWSIRCNGGLDLGTDIDRGDNVFRSRLNIENISGVVVPAKHNYWYGLKSLIYPNKSDTLNDEYILLVNEDDIQKTIVNIDPAKASYVDFVPFYAQDYFNQPQESGVTDWLFMEGQNWYKEDGLKPTDILLKLEEYKQ